MRKRIAIVFSLLLAGCASTPPPQLPSELLRDDLFTAAATRMDRAEIFALDDRMRSYLRDDIAALLRQKGLQRGLIDALYGHGLLRLDYEASMTRNAAQAFETRSGNCLSLVILTAALARELGLQVHYQSAYAEETWVRTGQLVLRSGHVNITVGDRLADMRSVRTPTETTVDFLPPEQLKGMRTREIAEDTVVAMFFNNRAVEALGAGRLDEAYGWARAAAGADPSFLSAVNTLGVVYARHGAVASAERAFAHVLAHEPGNTVAMANLVAALRQSGRPDEAARWQARLTDLEPEPPFHWLDLGRAALERGEAAAARDLFARELRRMPYHHELHYWLAMADYRLGDLDAARRHLAAAREHSTSVRDQGLYSAKLNWLRGQPAP